MKQLKRFHLLIALGIWSHVHANDLHSSIRDEISCAITEEDVDANAPTFKDYPATYVFSNKYARLKVIDDKSKRFRTILRKSSKQPPNFNGIYSVVLWGCGAGCIDFALINHNTGNITYPRTFSYLDAGSVLYESGKPVIEFENASRLLILSGALDEDPNQFGIHYFELIADSLKEIRFTKKNCADAQMKHNQ